MFKLKMQKTMTKADYYPMYREVMVYDEPEHGEPRWKWSVNCSGVPAYCGGRFAWEFQENFSMYDALIYWREHMKGKKLSDQHQKYLDTNMPRIEAWLDMIYLALCIEHIDYVLCTAGMRPTHDPKTWETYEKSSTVRKMLMDMSFWEITDRTMYWWGVHHGIEHLKDRENPNSGNSASFFAGPYNYKKYVELYEKYKGQFDVEWQDTPWMDIDTEDEDEDIDEDEREEW